jgi:KRAB domain-containing zinc finger protein
MKRNPTNVTNATTAQEIKYFLKNIVTTHMYVQMNAPRMDFTSATNVNFQYCQYLNEHINAIHLKLKNYKCEICEFATAQKCNLSEHVRFVHNKETPQICCPDCNFKCHYPAILKKHQMRRHTKEEDKIFHQCKVCQFKSVCSTTLKYHINSVHLNIQPFSCNICDQKFASKSYFNVHLKKFHNSDGLLANLKIKRFHCDICGFKCNQDFNLQRHKKRMHTDTKAYRCETCEKTFFSKAELKTHTSNVHLKEKRFACDLCDYRTVNNEELKNHKNAVHFNVKNYKCEICEYATVRKQKLAYHIRFVHYNERSHCCPYCSYKGSRAEDLKGHQMRKHTKDEDKIFFECNICHFKTVCKRSLKDHTKNVHLNIRPFSCSICDKTYPTKSTLNVHFKKVHTATDDIFVCEFCQKQFNWKPYLARHIKMYHKPKVE